MSDKAERGILSEGVWLFGLPIIAYYGTYWFERGYAGHFGLARDVVSIGSGNLILFIHALLATWFLVWYLGYGIAWVIAPAGWAAGEKHLGRHIGVSAWLLFIRTYANLVVSFGVIGAIGDSFGSDFWRMLALPFGWFGLDVFYCLVLSGGNSRLEALDRRVRDGLPFIPLLHAVEHPRMRLVKAMVVVWIIMVLGCLALGGRAARNEREFLFSEATSEIVVRRYGDTFVLAPFDRTKGTVKRQVRLISHTDLDSRLTTLKLSAPVEVAP